MRNNALQSLVVAILLSLLLHFFLIAKFSAWSGFSGNLDIPITMTLVPASHPVRDEVAIPEMVKAKPDLPPAKVKHPPPPSSPVPTESIPPETEDASAAVAEPETWVPEQVAPAQETHPAPEQPVMEPEPLPGPDYQMPEDIIEPPPPAHVEMELDILRKGGKVAGEQQSYRVSADGSYRLHSVVKAKGLLALALSDLVQHSEGRVNENGLQPDSFLYQYGSDASKKRQALFDWERGELTMVAGARSQMAALPPGAQDLMSFMYQFMYVPPLQQMQLAITNGKRLKTYAYEFEGEEVIRTGLGELRCIKIARSGNDGQEKTELWLASDYHYLPAKIRDTDEDGVVTERIVSKLLME